MPRYNASVLPSLLLAALFPIACAEPAEAPFDPAPWVERGVAVSSATFSVMSSRLLGRLQEGGVPAAIDYCSLVAYPLTDSLARAHNATIRRAALRYRNPENAPTDAERAVFEGFAAEMADGGQARPTAERLDDGSVAYYAPIVLLPQCTRCHGTIGVDITEEDYALIRGRYPADSAIGFAAGDLRGIWSIRFAPEK
jgi:hypothetical protein